MWHWFWQGNNKVVAVSIVFASQLTSSFLYLSSWRAEILLRCKAKLTKSDKLSATLQHSAAGSSWSSALVCIFIIQGARYSLSNNRPHFNNNWILILPIWARHHIWWSVTLYLNIDLMHPRQALSSHPSFPVDIWCLVLYFQIGIHWVDTRRQFIVLQWQRDKIRAAKLI